MAKIPGRERVKVELNFKPASMLDPGTKRELDKVAELKKAFAKVVKWSQTVEADPTKYSKAELDEHMEIVARWPYQVIGTYMSDAIKKGGKEFAKAKAQALKDLAEAEKLIPRRCEKKLEELVSGKEDNAKAQKRIDTAFDRIEEAKFDGSFDKPREKIVTALKDLEKGLKGGGDKKDAVKKARTAFGEAKKEFAEAGAIGQDAIDFLLKTARQIKNDRKADGALKEFGKLMAGDRSDFNAFEKKSNEFVAALAKGDKLLDSDEPDAAEVRKLADEFTKLSGLDKAARDIQAEMVKMKKKYEDIKKALYKKTR